MEGGEKQTSSATLSCTSSPRTSRTSGEAFDRSERSSSSSRRPRRSSQDGDLRTVSESSGNGAFHSGPPHKSASAPNSEQLPCAVRTGVFRVPAHASFRRGTHGSRERTTKTCDEANAVVAGGSHHVLRTLRRSVQTSSSSAQITLHGASPADIPSTECRSHLPLQEGDSKPLEMNRAELCNELKTYVEHAGGCGEHIAVLKPDDAGYGKVGVAGELTGSVLAYPMLETGGRALYGELGYDSPSGNVREMLKKANRYDSASESSEAERPKRRSRARRGDHSEPKQKYRDTTSPIVACMVNDAVDDLMDEFQTPDVMGADSDSLGYRPSVSLTAIRPSFQELEKVRTVCNMLESITGDMRNEVQFRKMDPVGLDENRRSSTRKKCGRKAKKAPMKRNSPTRRRSAAAMKGNEESENGDCDENKNKKVRFFTNLVFRNNAPSAVDISSSRDGAVLTVRRPEPLSTSGGAEGRYQQDPPLDWALSTPVNDEGVELCSSLESICCFGDPEESSAEDGAAGKKAEKHKKKKSKGGDDGEAGTPSEGQESPTKGSHSKAKKGRPSRKGEKPSKGKQNSDDDGEQKKPGRGDGGVSGPVSTKKAADKYGRRKPREGSESDEDVKIRKRNPRDDDRDVESDRWQENRPKEQPPVEDSGRKCRGSDYRRRDERNESDSDTPDGAPQRDHRTEVESGIGDRKPRRDGRRKDENDPSRGQRQSDYRRKTEDDFRDEDPEYRRDTERGYRDKDRRLERRRDTESGFRNRERSRDNRRTSEDDFTQSPRRRRKDFQSEFKEKSHGRWKDEADAREQRRDAEDDFRNRRSSREHCPDAGSYSRQTSRERLADTTDSYRRQSPGDEWTDGRAERRRSQKERVAEGYESKEPSRKERERHRGKEVARSHRRDEKFGVRQPSREWIERRGRNSTVDDLGSPPSSPTYVTSPADSAASQVSARMEYVSVLQMEPESDGARTIYGRAPSGLDLPQTVRQLSAEEHVGRRDLRCRKGLEQDIDTRTGKAAASEAPPKQQTPCRTTPVDDAEPEMAIRMKVGRRLRHRVKDASELPADQDGYVGSSLGQEITFMTSPNSTVEQLRAGPVEEVTVRKESQLSVRGVESFQKGSPSEVRRKDKLRSPKNKRGTEKSTAPTLPSIYEEARSKFEDEAGTRPRINVWHIPSEDLERHLANVASKRSGSRRTKRSKSKRSESGRGGVREIKEDVIGERYRHGQEKAFNADVVGDTANQNERMELEVESFGTKQMERQEPLTSLSVEMINQPEASTQRTSEQDAPTPYFTTRVRRSLRLPPLSAPFMAMAPGMQRPSGMNRMPAQQTATFPGFGGGVGLSQTSDRVQSVLQQSTYRVIGPTTQTFQLPSKGGQTILTQFAGHPATTSHETGDQQAAEPSRQPLSQQFRLQSKPVFQPYTAHQTGTVFGNRSPGPAQHALAFQSIPANEPPQQKQEMSRKEPYQEHGMTSVKRDIRHIIVPGPVPLTSMTPTFVAKTPLFPNSPQPRRHHNALYPRSPWQRQRFGHRIPLGAKTGFIPSRMTTPGPHGAVSQPALTPGSVGMPHASNSFVTAFETADAPATVRIPKSIQTLASTSAPALDQVLTAAASISYSTSSVSGEDEVHTTTDSPWQTEPPDEWDRGKPGSTDMMLPKKLRHTGNPPKGLQGLTYKGRYVLYFALLVVSLAGVAGALSFYSKRRWTSDEEEEGHEGAEGAKMFGPMQRINDARNVSHNATRSCTGLRCSLEAQSLTRALDRSVNPCDDFYGYVCSSQWKPGGTYASVDAAVQGDIERAVASFFKDGVSRSPNVAASKQFWRDCINTEAIAELGKGPFDNILNMTGLMGWPYAAYDHQSDVSDAWKVAGKVMRHLGLSPLLKVTLAPSQRHHKKEVIFARGEDVPLALEDVHRVVARDALTADVVKAIRVIHNTRFKHSEIAMEVVDFVYKLSLLDDNDAKRQEGLSPSVRLFAASAFGEQSHIPGNGTTFTTQTSKIVDAVVNLVESTSSRITLNYLGFCVVRHASLFAPASAEEVLSFGKRSPVAATREAQCVRTLLIDALPRYVAEHVSYAALRNNIDLPALRVLSADIKKSLVSRVSRLHWMDTTTRSLAVRHLKEVQVRFFFEDEPVSNSSQTNSLGRLPDIVPSQALLSYQRLRAYRFRSSLDDSLESVSNWSGSFSHSDCTYYADRRVLLLPLVTLNVKGALSPFGQLFQVPRFGVKLLRCLLRVLLGGNIDSQGRTPSLIRSWWALPARRHYESIRACLDKQYLRLRDPVGNKLADRRDLLAALNVIDNAVIGPVRDIYEAYAYPLKRTGTSQENESFEGMSWEQLFYASYARSMCEVPDHGLNFRRATTAYESPNWERVNIPLGNDDQFMKAFKCGGSSAMNREPRCRIWG